VQGCSRGRLYGRRRYRGSPPRGDHDSIGAETVRRANQGAEVLRIQNSIQDQDQVLRGGRMAIGQHRFDSRIGKGPYCSGDTLVAAMTAQPVEGPPLHDIDASSPLGRESLQFRSVRSSPSFSQ